MTRTRVTINGREYDDPEAMPPEVRRAFEDVMRQMGPALEDRDGDGIPDAVQGEAGAGPRGGLVVENQIVVNEQTYRSADDMPAEVRRLYDDAMGQVRRGSGITVTRSGPTFSIGFTRAERPTPPMGVTSETPRAIEPSAIESSLRTALVVLAVVVIGGLAAWALLGR